MMITLEQLSPKQREEIKVQLQWKILSLEQRCNSMKKVLDRSWQRTETHQAATKALTHLSNVAHQILEVLVQHGANAALIAEQQAVADKYQLQLNNLPKNSRRVLWPTELLRLELTLSEFLGKKQLAETKLAEILALQTA